MANWQLFALASQGFRFCLLATLWCCLSGWPAAAQEPPVADAIPVTVPDVWKRPPAGPLAIEEGAVWYRAVVVPPADWEGQELTLFVEAVDDARQVFFNGRQIGILGTFPPEFRSGLGQSQRLVVAAGDFYY